MLEMPFCTSIWVTSSPSATLTPIGASGGSLVQQRGTAVSDNRCKGIVFHTFVDVLGKEHGQEAVAETLTSLSDELREMFTFGAIVKGGWYSLDHYCELHRSAQRVTSVGESLAHTVGRISTHDDLRAGIYKIFTRVLAPAFVISKAPLIFNRYYEQGRMIVDETRDGMASARWEGCVGFERNIWLDVFGGCEGALEACGARNVRRRVVAGGRNGDAASTLEIRWV